METIAYEELLAKDGRVMTHVVGSSMLPLLRDRQRYSMSVPWMTV